MIHALIGPPATGDGYYDREEEVREVLKHLENGSVILVAPRRFGKTSIMLRVKELLVQRGHLAFYLEVEWIDNIVTFLTEVFARLREEAKIKDRIQSKFAGLLNGLLGSIDELSIYDFKIRLKESLKHTWEDKGRELLSSLERDQRIVLIVDELPLMLLNMRKAGLQNHELLRFLQWLRSIRQSCPNTRFLLGGSVGFEHIIHEIGAEALATVNDTARIRVRPFSQEVAKNFVKELLESEGIEASDVIVDDILTVIGVPIPYFIQILVMAVRETTAEGAKVESGLARQAYEKKFLSPEYRSYFDHYINRLEIYYDRVEVNAAKKILTDIAKKGKSTNRELYNIYVASTQSQDYDRFTLLMSRLENDFYVSRTEEVYSFASGVLRDIWLGHYGVISV